MRRLGIAYENGEGVTRDIAKALDWYRKAAAEGDKSAKDALRRLNEEQ